MGNPYQPAQWSDSFAAFPLGMDSDVPSQDLPKTQLAYLENGTVRGNYITHRPPINDITLVPDATVAAGWDSKSWQGAGFYNSTNGVGSLVALIGGHMFLVTPNVNTATVTDISIPGDYNPDVATRSWVWQSENFLIWNDGQDLPVFYDGATSRRSNGETTLLGVVASVPGNAPLQGSTITVTMTAPYIGPFNVPVEFNGAFYQPISAGGSGVQYLVTLTTVYVATGATGAAGTQIFVEPQNLGYSKAATVIGAGTYTNQVSFFNLAEFYAGGGTLLATDSNNIQRSFTIRSADSTTVGGNLVAINLNGTLPAMTFPAGIKVQLSGSSPNVLIGSAVNPFTVPAAGNSVTIELTSPYVGPAGATVFGGNVQYHITAAASPPTGNSLTLINLTDDYNAVYNLIEFPNIMSVPELPPGRMGAYILGRNWMSLVDGRSFIASDIVGGSGGTPAYQYRDAPLKLTENTYLAGGGIFYVPSSGQIISSIRGVANLDTAQGQGPVIIGTLDGLFTNNAPADRLLWQDMTNPILTEGLIKNGSESQESTVVVNGDLYFRSIDGIRSWLISRRDFEATHGNAPQSTEMSRVLLADNRALLPFASAVVFDNRLLMTASPIQGPLGVYHETIIALNFDPSSGIRDKKRDVYDGAWTGLKVLQLVQGRFSGIERAFAFCYDSTNNKIILKEITTTRILVTAESSFDNGTERISLFFESPSLFYQPDTKNRSLLKLNDGEIFVKDLLGTTRFDVYYRPDYDSNWHPWHSWEVTPGPNWQPRMGLGQPKPDSDTLTQRPYRIGYSFQTKIVITGACTFMGGNFYATVEAQPQFPKPLPALTPPP